MGIEIMGGQLKWIQALPTTTTTTLSPFNSFKAKRLMHPQIGLKSPFLGSKISFGLLRESSLGLQCQRLLSQEKKKVPLKRAINSMSFFTFRDNEDFNENLTSWFKDLVHKYQQEMQDQTKIIAPNSKKHDQTKDNYMSHNIDILTENPQHDNEYMNNFEVIIESDDDDDKEERTAWENILKGTFEMQASIRHEMLMDEEIFLNLVAPVTAIIEPEDMSSYQKTELMYYNVILEEPNNALLLSNFAQFLFIVLHDHKRAKEYFKKAVEVTPTDAEAFSRYARFLWVVNKDLAAAEEMYLQAIEEEPGNPFYIANYASFLLSNKNAITYYMPRE